MRLEVICLWNKMGALCKPKNMFGTEIQFWAMIIPVSCSITKLCPTLCNPMDCSMQAPLSFTISRSLLKLMSIELVMPSNHLTFCHALLLLPSIFSSIREDLYQWVDSSHQMAKVLDSFSISPFSEYSGLISFRIDWFHLLEVQGTLKSLLQHQFESINSLVLDLLYGPILT